MLTYDFLTTQQNFNLSFIWHDKTNPTNFYKHSKNITFLHVSNHTLLQVFSKRAKSKYQRWKKVAKEVNFNHWIQTFTTINRTKIHKNYRSTTLKAVYLEIKVQPEIDLEVCTNPNSSNKYWPSPVDKSNPSGSWPRLWSIWRTPTLPPRLDWRTRQWKNNN
jgi:uncharacterized DUF497 family protein